MTKRLTEGAEWKQILLFSLPIMAGQLLQQLYNTVDGIVVGNFVSSNALAAVGSCGTLSMLFIALAIGMANGSGIVIAQLFGARREQELRRTVSTALIMLFVLGVVFTLLGVAGSPFIMTYVLGIGDASIHAQATSYFRIYSLGLIFQFLYNAVASILRAVGDSKAALYFLLVSTVLNVAGDLLLVAVIPMGVAGAAIATVAAQAVCAAVSFVYMFRRYEMFRFRLRELVFDREKFGMCLRMGIPTSVQQLVVSSGNVLLQRLVNSFGPVTMAAYTVGVRFDNYMRVPAQGFFTGIATFSGQNMGAGRPERVKRGLFATSAMDLVSVVLLGALAYVFAEPLARLFGVEGEILAQAVEFLRFMCLSYPIFAIYFPFNGAFQGCGDTTHSLLAAVIDLVVKVAGAYALAYFGVGYSSCWKSNIIGWCVVLVYVSVYFAGGKWKSKALVGQNAVLDGETGAGI